MGDRWQLRLAGLLLGALPVTAFAEAEGVTPDRAAELQRLVEQDCGSCHGLTRKGGLGSPLTREALAGHSAASIAATILDGVPGTAMPPWRQLMTEEDARWIAGFLLLEDRAR